MSRVKREVNGVTISQSFRSCQATLVSDNHISSFSAKVYRNKNVIQITYSLQYLCLKRIAMHFKLEGVSAACRDVSNSASSQCAQLSTALFAFACSNHTSEHDLLCCIFLNVDAPAEIFCFFIYMHHQFMTLSTRKSVDSERAAARLHFYRNILNL